MCIRQEKQRIWRSSRRWARRAIPMDSFRIPCLVARASGLCRLQQLQSTRLGMTSQWTSECPPHILYCVYIIMFCHGVFLAIPRGILLTSAASNVLFLSRKPLPLMNFCPLLNESHFCANNYCLSWLFVLPFVSLCLYFVFLCFLRDYILLEIQITLISFPLPPHHISSTDPPPPLSPS